MGIFPIFSHRAQVSRLHRRPVSTSNLNSPFVDAVRMLPFSNQARYWSMNQVCLWANRLSHLYVATAAYLYRHCQVLTDSLFPHFGSCQLHYRLTRRARSELTMFSLYECLPSGPVSFSGFLVGIVSSMVLHRCIHGWLDCWAHQGATRAVVHLLAIGY